MDLEEVRRFGGDPVTLLDSKTRSKIRRAKREYSAVAELRIETASTVVQGLDVWIRSKCFIRKLDCKR